MFETQCNYHGIKLKQFWFVDKPFKVTGCMIADFYHCATPEAPSFFQKRTDILEVIDLSQPIDKIWSDFNRTTRNEITQMMKKDPKISINTGHREFIKVLKEFAKRKNFGAPDLDPEYLSSNPLVTLFCAFDENNMANNYHLYFTDKHRGIFSLMYAPSVVSNSKLDRYLHYQAIVHAKNAGFRWYSLGGIDGDKLVGVPEKAFDYKHMFGGQRMETHSFRYYPNPLFKYVYDAARAVMKRL